MNKLFKSWRLLTVALATAVAVIVGTSAASAAEPGEGSSWTNELIGGGPVHSPDTYAEARGPYGTLVQIYRGDDNRVWIAVDNGNAFPAGGGSNTTQTNVAPRVVYMDGWFYAFHTGTDNHIYWSRAFDGTVGSNTPSESRAGSWSPWRAISGDPATTQSVSVAVAPGNGLLMTWSGVNQTAMYSAWLQSGSDVFNATRSIPFHSNNAPTVAFSESEDRFFLAYRGLLDNQVYRAEQFIGQSTWDENTVLPGLQTVTSPTIAVDGNGNQFIAAVIAGGGRYYAAINSQGASRGWSHDATADQTNVPVFMSVVGTIFWVIMRNSRTGLIQYKPGWTAGNGI